MPMKEHPRSRLRRRNRITEAKILIRHLRRIGWKASLVYLLKRYKKQVFWGVGILFAILLFIPIFTYVYFASDLKDKVSITARSKTGLTLTDDEGETFFTFYQPKEVTYIPIAQIPKSMQNAVIASEDRNFYTNPGFSVSGMGRAFVRNLIAGHVVEGGSTISQELVKIALLNSERTVLRKYQELVLATELNRRFSKEDILEMYLNSVYFGEGAFGIENAAQAYFGVPASQLTLEQSAILVGLIPAPSARSPLTNDPDIAHRNANVVLNSMVEENYITQDQAEAAKDTTLTYNPAPKKVGNNTLAPHFALYVKDQLIKKYGEERIIREGFKVQTTMHRPWQEYAERAVKTQLNYLQWNDAHNAAAVAIDPKNGRIKVMVGSVDWDNEEFGKANMAVTPRQPGSSFKPIIYADALEQKKITPATILHDAPIEYGPYKPENYDKTTRGDVTVRRALANSLNIPAVEVMNMVGVSSGLNMSRKLGITTLNESPSSYGLPLVLGSGEVKLLELTNAYAVFAAQGVYNPPTAIIEIKNKYDKIVDTNNKNFFSFFTDAFSNITNLFTGSSSNERRQAISNDTAFLISSILSDNYARAEEFGGALTISRTAAVKTGTTNDYKDALTVGYTPGLVVGVWVGNNDNKPMDNIAGSMGAAPIWRNMMNTFLIGMPVETFIKPSSIVSVQLCLTPGTSTKTITEYFISGTQPEGCSMPTSSPTPATSETPTPGPTNQPTETPTETPTPSPTTNDVQVTATPAVQGIQTTLQPTVQLDRPRQNR